MIENENITIAPQKKKSRLGEIFRFIVIGCLCTIIDFAIEYLLGLAFANNLSLLGSKTTDGNVIPGYGSYLAISICVICGFGISLLVNFFFSRKWVFQDVDKNTNYNTPRYFWKYTWFAIGGLALGIGVQCLCLWVIDLIWDINLSIDPFQKVDWGKLFHDGNIAFWAFFAAFCIKTFIVLFYNYWTRKTFIFKSPKTAVVVDKASTSINDEVIKNHYRSDATVFSDLAPGASKEEKKEEPKIVPMIEHKVEEKKKVIPTNDNVDVVFGKPQFNWGKRLTKQNVRDIIYASLEIYDKRTTPVASKATIKKMIVDAILEEDDKMRRGIDE